MKICEKEELKNEKVKLHRMLKDSLKSFKGSINREEKDYIKDVIRSFNKNWIRDKKLQNQINGLIRECIINYDNEECRFEHGYNDEIHGVYKRKVISETTTEIIGIDDTHVQTDRYERKGDYTVLDRTRYSVWGTVFNTDFTDGRDSTYRNHYDNGRLVEESKRLDFKYYGEFDYGRWQTFIYKDDGSVLEKIENDLGHMIDAKCTKDGNLLWEENIARDEDGSISTLRIYKKDGTEIILIRDGLDWILEAKKIKIENGNEKIIWSMEGLDKKINEHRFDGDKCRFMKYDVNGTEKYDFPIEDFQFQFWKLTGFDLASNKYRKEYASYYDREKTF